MIFTLQGLISRTQQHLKIFFLWCSLLPLIQVNVWANQTDSAPACKNDPIAQGCSGWGLYSYYSVVPHTTDIWFSGLELAGYTYPLRRFFAGGSGGIGGGTNSFFLAAGPDLGYQFFEIWRLSFALGYSYRLFYGWGDFAGLGSFHGPYINMPVTIWDELQLAINYSYLWSTIDGITYENPFLTLGLVWYF